MDKAKRNLAEVRGTTAALNFIVVNGGVNLDAINAIRMIISSIIDVINDDKKFVTYRNAWISILVHMGITKKRARQLFSIMTEEVKKAL